MSIFAKFCKNHCFFLYKLLQLFKIQTARATNLVHTSLRPWDSNGFLDIFFFKTFFAQYCANRVWSANFRYFYHCSTQTGPPHKIPNRARHRLVSHTVAILNIQGIFCTFYFFKKICSILRKSRFTENRLKLAIFAYLNSMSRQTVHAINLCHTPLRPWG